MIGSEVTCIINGQFTLCEGEPRLRPRTGLAWRIGGQGTYTVTLSMRYEGPAVRCPFTYVGNFDRACRTRATYDR